MVAPATAPTMAPTGGKKLPSTNPVAPLTAIRTRLRRLLLFFLWKASSSNTADMTEDCCTTLTCTDGEGFDADEDGFDAVKLSVVAGGAKGVAATVVFVATASWGPKG
jgi:hypothetical protein